MLISQVTKPFNMKKFNFQLISIKSIKAYSTGKINHELLYNLNFPENGSTICMNIMYLASWTQFIKKINECPTVPSSFWNKTEL